MPKKLSSHEKVVRAVERRVKRATASFYDKPMQDALKRLWHDFADTTDVGRTRKPETWAAALAYTFDRMHFGGYSQQDAADEFKVSSISVSQKHGQLVDALDLKLLDDRYVSVPLQHAIRRKYGKLPENLPLRETPTTWWYMPSWDVDTSGMNAQELIYAGWEALGDSLERAQQLFEAALEQDAYLGDAHNGLAEVAWSRSDLQEAEKHYQQAYEVERSSLGTEALRAFYWWSEHQTRPYMRARAGLASVYAEQGRYHEAAAVYEDLLRRNPDDNQGVRYLIGPLYLQANDLERAQTAFATYAETYPDDGGDPHHVFCWALLDWLQGRTEDALQRWYRALYCNIYLAPLLLDLNLPPIDLWYGINLAWPDYAESYIDFYGSLWADCKEARTALRHLWRDPFVEAQVKRWVTLRQQMHTHSMTRRGDLDAKDAWMTLLNEVWEIEKTALSPEVLARIQRRMKLRIVK